LRFAGCGLPIAVIDMPLAVCARRFQLTNRCTPRSVAYAGGAVRERPHCVRCHRHARRRPSDAVPGLRTARASQSRPAPRSDPVWIGWSRTAAETWHSGRPPPGRGPTYAVALPPERPPPQPRLPPIVTRKWICGAGRPAASPGSRE
jgi:hypothetical protein